MCGRFNLRTTSSELAAFFQTSSCFDFPQRYNIAPTQVVAVAHLDDSGDRQLSPMRWGLIPSWAKDIKIGYKLMNARQETLAEKPSFRAAYKRRRCLVPATGFYEWRREGKTKIPYHIHKLDDSLFAMAGLWETWHDNGSEIQSFSIVTTAANSLLAGLHQRMPVVIPRDQFSVWFDEEMNAQGLQPMLEPYEWTDFAVVPVSTTVNNARNDTPECLEAAEL